MGQWGQWAKVQRGLGGRGRGSQNAEVLPQCWWPFSRRPLDLSNGPDRAFTGCGSPMSQSWWGKHSRLCVASAGRPSFAARSPLQHPHGPVHGRTDRRVPEGQMELPLSPKPGDLSLLRESSFLILR